MADVVVKLRFSAPVHFGDGRLSGGECSCDAATLFSALYIEALRLGLAGPLLDAVRSGELLISDTFPFVGDALYLPKPMLPAGGSVDTGAQPQDGAGDSVLKKAFKKLKYLPSDSYGDYLTGTLDPVLELGRFELGEPATQTKVNLTREHKDDAEPYHVGSFSFNDNAGLYFIARGAFDLDGLLIPLLEQLQYSGIGGERSSGYGRFCYSVSTGSPLTHIPSKVPSALKHILLSSAAPTPSELNDDLLVGARYGLRRRGGFVQSANHSATPQKRRDFYVFAAGSVFATRFDGDVFDVNATPGAHPVYRYARAMWLEV
jgi:CRISPR-associated protein Csm4